MPVIVPPLTSSLLALISIPVDPDILPPLIVVILFLCGKYIPTPPVAIKVPSLIVILTLPLFSLPLPVTAISVPLIVPPFTVRVEPPKAPIPAPWVPRASIVPSFIVVVLLASRLIAWSFSLSDFTKPPFISKVELGPTWIPVALVECTIPDFKIKFFSL